MKDYEKAEQAIKLLGESGVEYVLAYRDDAGCKTTMQGEYKDINQFKAGWVYRTREEAEAALPKVAEELGVKYEI